jgi:putative glutamine transport system ATP-binding protein
MTMVIVSHEMDFAHQVASRMVLMEDGKIIEDAAATKFFDKPEKEQTRNFLRRFDASRE